MERKGIRLNFAYIDGTNLHKGIRELGWKLDYKRFRIFLRDKYRVEKAYIFLGFVAKNSQMYKDFGLMELLGARNASGHF